MNSEKKNILLIGTPGTGKTSFLAALHHNTIDDREPKVIYQHKQGANTDYLNKIHSKWLSCIQPDRTAFEQQSKNVEMFLKVAETNEEVTLDIPDIAGETFDQEFWTFRSWTKEYRDTVVNCSGLIVFIHPKKIRTHVLITDLSRLKELMGTDPANQNDDGKQKDPTPIIPWKNEYAPSQVILVDLLQVHLDVLNNDKTVPIAFIISAWDEVIKENDQITPAQWVESNMPLLYQYLMSNKELISYITYGVSALGGDISKPEISTELKRFDEPSDRVKIQEGTLIHNDICSPIKWIIDQWKKVEN